eukprot:145562-Pelagomonas_calceolata.AAC.2
MHCKVDVETHMSFQACVMELSNTLLGDTEHLFSLLKGRASSSGCIITFCKVLTAPLYVQGSQVRFCRQKPFLGSWVSEI